MTSLMNLRTLAATAALLLPASLFAASISGTVTDKTTGKPSANDTVTLIKLAQGMQESTQTKTDASGHYSIELPDDGMHLIRVTHQGANYFQPAMPGAPTVDVAVYDVAAKVDGVSGEADVMRIQTGPGGDSLDIIENFFVKNVSSPQRTQYSDHAFEFYLPAGAVLESSVAVSPQADDSPMQSMPVRTAPRQLDGNHYAFDFPIRPGETRFQVSYHIPYHGSATITPRPVLPGGAVVAMLPTSMTFKGPDAYAAVPPDAAGAGAQTYAIPHATPGQSLQFTISGSGELPRDTPSTPENAQSRGAADQQQAANPNDMRPGGGLGNPVDPNDTHDPLSKYKWWIISGLALLLAAVAGFLVQKPKQPATAPVPTPAPTPIATPQTQRTQTLAALKEELFSLETERAEGRLSEESYQEQKAALEVVLKRALTRN